MYQQSSKITSKKVGIQGERTISRWLAIDSVPGFVHDQVLTTDTNWVTVNLQPDLRGPSQRNCKTIETASTGHLRAPPSQRLEDPTRAPHGSTPYSTATDAPEGRQYYSVIIDKGTSRELSLPRTTGCPHSYK